MIPRTVARSKDKRRTRQGARWSRWVDVVVIRRRCAVRRIGRERRRLVNGNVDHHSVIESCSLVTGRRVVRLGSDRLVVVRYEVRLRLTTVIIWRCLRAWYVYFTNPVLHFFEIIGMKNIAFMILTLRALFIYKTIRTLVKLPKP